MLCAGSLQYIRLNVRASRCHFTSLQYSTLQGGTQSEWERGSTWEIRFLSAKISSVARREAAGWSLPLEFECPFVWL